MCLSFFKYEYIYQVRVQLTFFRTEIYLLSSWFLSQQYCGAGAESQIEPKLNCLPKPKYKLRLSWLLSISGDLKKRYTCSKNHGWSRSRKSDLRLPGAGAERNISASQHCWSVSKFHKVLTYTEHHSVCPLVGIGTPPIPLPQASVPSPPDQRVGGHTRLSLRGWGSSNSDAGAKSLALCLLCGKFAVVRLTVEAVC
jgi:hypothetical protein